ncbi:MAG: hypothetical protein J2P17_09860 [Mycobacterium sp.]|nr:hypothetical protein [Mycobacterium sp.]
MEAAQAIALVSDYIRSRGLDYPSEGLEAVPFDAGWRVYAPVDIDESDPMAFLDMPVGRSVFLVGNSGRIEETSTSIPPRQAHERFMEHESRTGPADGASGDREFMAALEHRFNELSADGPPTASDFTIVDDSAEAANGDRHTLNLSDEAPVAAQASRLLDPIVQQLAQLGPPGWERLSAVFAFTVSAEVAQLRFWSDDQAGMVPVPESIAQLVRQQREVAAAMPAGPWWRMLLTVTNRGEMTADYDYGDEPFPDDQLLAPEHYRNDLDTYRRNQVPVWLAGYTAGPVQSRSPERAAADTAADTDAARTGTSSQDLPTLPDLWARWAVLSAVYVGVKSEWGPRIYPGYGWYESDHRSGSTLYVLPGNRAVVSGGKWNSALLENAYNGGQPLPELYTGAPDWVNDTVLNTRNRNGLLSFCYWWADEAWYRGATDTATEVGDSLPSVLTADQTVQAMISQTSPGAEEHCHALLTAASNRTATHLDVAAIFTDHPDADVAAAVNQLSLAGLLAPYTLDGISRLSAP